MRQDKLRVLNSLLKDKVKWHQMLSNSLNQQVVNCLGVELCLLNCQLILRYLTQGFCQDFKSRSTTFLL